MGGERAFIWGDGGRGRKGGLPEEFWCELFWPMNSRSGMNLQPIMQGIHRTPHVKSDLRSLLETFLTKWRNKLRRGRVRPPTQPLIVSQLRINRSEIVDASFILVETFLFADAYRCTLT
jgi:hypothetical protein